MVLPRQLIPMTAHLRRGPSCRPRPSRTSSRGQCAGLKRVDATFAQLVEAFLGFGEAVGWEYALARRIAREGQGEEDEGG